MTTGKTAKVIVHALEPEQMLERLSARYPSIEAIGCTTYADLPSDLAAFRPDIYYGIRFAGTDGFPRDALFGEFGPKWISVGGSGVDHLHSWNPNQIHVTNSAGVAASAMAEFMLGGFLHFTLDVAGLERDRTNRVWQSDRQIIPLSNKTLLIVGLGQTGSALAQRAKAFGMKVIGIRARPKSTDNVDEIYTADRLPELWHRADFVAVCVPLLNSTRGLIGTSAFDRMRKGTVIADVSRGGVMDGAALIEALMTEKLGGAVLDVFETEPLPQGHQLWDLENVLVSPHCSSVFDGWEMASFDMFCDNLDNYLAGRQLTNLVDPQRGY